MSTSWILSLDRGCLVLVPAEKVGGAKGAYSPALVRGKRDGWLFFTADLVSNPGSHKRFSMPMKDIALKQVDQAVWNASAKRLAELAAIEDVVLTEPFASQSGKAGAGAPDAAAPTSGKKDEIQVCITTLSGRSEDLSVPRDASVSELQDLVMKAIEIPAAEQRLILEADCLDNLSSQPFLDYASDTAMLFVVRRMPAKEVVLNTSEENQTWVAHLDEASGCHIRLLVQGTAGERVQPRAIVSRVADVLESHQHAVIGLTMNRIPFLEPDDLAILIQAFPIELKEINLAGMLDGRGLCLLASALPDKLTTLTVSRCRCQCDNSFHEIKRDMDVVVEECPACRSLDMLLNVIQQHSSLEVVVARNTFTNKQRNYIRSKMSKSSMIKLVF